jgi:hypothetical protein
MWQLSEAGIDVPSRYWETVDEAWRRTQRDDGGWGYGLDVNEPALAVIPPEQRISSSVSMTAAGVATLYITKTMLGAAGRTDCKIPFTVDKSIERGLKYLGDAFDKDSTLSSSLYAWYGMERIGLASGRRYIGTNDWYKMGAERMVNSQAPDGSISMNGLDPMCNTSFMLLFLARGGAPIVMQKLEYAVPDPHDGNAAISDETHWNRRPRDVANLISWLGQEWETPVTWQSVSLTEPVDDFDDAPILYIAGSVPPKLTDADKQKLKQYVEEGGMILGNANCNDAAFAEWFKKLGGELFPMYEFRALPKNHTIFAGQQFPYPADKPHPGLAGLSNNVREMMILMDGDPSAAWQTKAKTAKRAAFNIAADIYQYANGGPAAFMRRRGQTYFVRPAADIHPSAHLKVARLKYESNWDPEPGGWRRLAAVLHNANKVELEIQTVALGKESLSGCRFAHLTGNTNCKFTAAELGAIKDFIKEGGTLLIDGDGGQSGFNAGVNDQLCTLFSTELAGAVSMPLLSPDDPIYTTGGPLNVEYRPFARAAGRPRKGQDAHLRCIVIDHRKAVYFSQDDLSAGLVGATADGIVGYEPTTAVELTSRIIMSLVNSPAPAPGQ